MPQRISVISVPASALRIASAGIIGEDAGHRL